ncbi:tRNA (N6-threonylcarbamoyladenosine(37)-N6)-methyltransferase TrmO [Halomonas urumqiensis]|uniref:tRNA (N6-threonylcarbamoyladenosine(37)-N6)-methyltransferase TrmO n=2 Tax=Halomonas urumqiensis TaxID=1684789 RepID=A0A2N7UH06_9GAMM|nr:tRNA (N6-threonylcarbamoyladenosine(37)-N6)-methyltransferase TrmO [Halomonas urumqiensis]PTB03079.1 tRNA (N6-threonylcarbamoyladenosine(37)-N6)-methyltransferase TrmO [Halomonas urumqiensis]GHE20785.1 tRNA (N6-threonylcarbamoyladenosine(37)-N6)-methyltransferase TrmO [Halomonas urumqiensis]
MPPDALTLTPIGVIKSDYPDKFGIPRQPGLAPAAQASLVLLPPYDDPLAVRGLDDFSHIWLTFIFHLSPERGFTNSPGRGFTNSPGRGFKNSPERGGKNSPERGGNNSPEHGPEKWSPLVRPPRLGGNAKVGVFASRSTHRPNRLGLSLVELVDIDTRGGVRLHLKGADLVNGTPVLDIKPYLPWAEAHPEARAGFAPQAPVCLAVTFSDQAEVDLANHPHAAALRELIVQVLAQDPRPGYRKGGDTRRYGVRLRDVDVRFSVSTTEGHETLVVEAIVSFNDIRY